MLPEIEIAYDSFKLETETDAPKVPTTWTLSEADRKKQPNYNILFGAETNYYENNPYWKIVKGTETAMNLNATDEEGKGILKLSATGTLIKCKNANIITPNSEVHYSFSFDAMYGAADILGGKIDVYFMYAYNPPFETITSTHTQTVVGDNTYTYETIEGDIIIPPELERSEVFDEVTGTYVFAHEQFELTKGWQRYAMFTNHVRKLNDDILHDDPYVYDFYILIAHPGSAQGMARRSEVYIKCCKLERGLFPTPYEINLDEYKGCTYDLIPYFETVEVRTNKAMNLTQFDVTTKTFESKRTYDDPTTGDSVTVNLADSNIYTITEEPDDEDIMDWYTFYDNYTNIVDDNTIAYISTGVSPNNVAAPVIIHHTLKNYNDHIVDDDSYKFYITCTTQYATIFYYREYKILYRTDENTLIPDYEKVTLNNGTLYIEGKEETLVRSATVYAIAKRDLYNNSPLVSYTYTAVTPYIKNINGLYTAYIMNNSMSMGQTSAINIKDNPVIFGNNDNDNLVGNIVNTFIFTFNTAKEI